MRETEGLFMGSDDDEMQRGSGGRHSLSGDIFLVLLFRRFPFLLALFLIFCSFLTTCQN
jgi:hypothetical protein